MKSFKQFILEAEKLSGPPVNQNQIISLSDVQKALQSQGQLPKNKNLRLMPPYAQPTGAHYGKY